MRLAIKLLKIASLFTILFSPNLLAQTNTYNVDLPQILPASPEPTNFVKAGVGNTNMSSGASTATIPLYTIKVRDFSFPISLTYSTQGLKADEPCSRAGLGWVMAATGVITRSVKGEPDEFSQRMPLLSDYVTDDPNNILYQYCQNASTSGAGYDTQPDEFQFNFNGYSGKFVLDNDYKARVTATSNLKIDVQMTVTSLSTSGEISRITITTPDGVRYLFGINFEITSSISMTRYDQYRLVTRTAFFLDRIDLPTGEYISFNYTPISIDVATGITQTWKAASGNGDCDNCAALFGTDTYTTVNDKMRYNTRYLNSINVSNGTTVDLTYESTPGSNDVRVNQLNVPGQKKYYFHYYDVPHFSYTITPRFFLTSLSDVGLNNSILNYTFGYDRMEEVPLPITTQQDYLGFYNGNGSGYLIPPTKEANGEMDFSFRGPNSNKSKIGTLTSIQYPTGGREEFFYEGNTSAMQVPAQSETASYELSGTGGGSGGSTLRISYYNNSVTVPFSQNVTLSASVSDALPDDGQTTDPDHPTLSVWIYEGDELIASRSVTGYGSTSTTAFLEAGHTYQLKMEVRSYTEMGYSSITYNLTQVSGYVNVNKVMPGVRLRQIRYTDPYTSATHSKYFTYASLDNLSVSSGDGLANVFKSSSLIRKFCGSNDSFQSDCTTEIYSSNTTNEVYSISGNGSPVYYRSVIESDDPDFKNGGTEFTFYPNDDGTNRDLIRGTAIPPYLGGGQNPTLTGVVSMKRVFNNDKTVVSTEEDDYETLIDQATMPIAIYVRKNYEPSPNRPDKMDAFDIIRMMYGDYWIRLKTKTETNYSNGQALVQQQQYSYGTNVNVLPASILTTDSKGKQLQSVMKYPNTYTFMGVGDADPALVGYSQLVLKNIVSPPVYEAAYKNGTLLQEKRTIYNDWFGDLSVIAPERVQVKMSQNDVLHDVLLFKQYDNNGNPLHLQKQNDLDMIYIWDTQLGVPIAEVKNALPDRVAYTSFENNAYGNWQLLTGGVFDPLHFTGTQSYSGSLQMNNLPSGAYVVTLWASGSIPIMNGTIGTKLRSVGAWDAYEWKLTLSSSGTINVQGDKIDEVRLLPAHSVMESFTYKPFVGITTRSDANQKTLFYEYDAYNRLSLIKDQDGNVIKTFDYHYQQQN